MWLSSKESACNAGDTSSGSWIPGSGRFLRGRNGNQLQYSCLRNLMDRGAWRAIVHGVAESDTTEHACMHIKKINMYISYNPQNLLPGYTLEIFSYMCKCHYFNAQSKILKQSFQEGKLCVPSFPFISLLGKFIPCLCACMLKSLQLCLTLCELSHTESYELQPARLLWPWDSPGKNTGVGCHALLQGIFLTQGLNPHLLSPPALAGRFFTNSATWEALSHVYEEVNPIHFWSLFNNVKCYWIIDSYTIHS